MNIDSLFCKSIFNSLIPIVVLLVFFVNPLARGASQDDRSGVNLKTAQAETVNGFKRMDLGNGRTLFINEAMALESYDNWIIDPSSFDFKKRQRALSKREERRLKALLIAARKEQTESYGGTVVKATSPCTLTQQLHLKRLRLNHSGTGGSQVNFTKSFGSTTIVAEVKDSQSGELVFAYMENIALGGGVSSSGGANIARLGKAIKMVMANAQSVLLDILPMKPKRITERSEFGCSGTLGLNMQQIRAARARQAVD